MDHDVPPAAAEIDVLLQTLPPPLQEALRGVPRQDLLEIILDLGRPPEARLGEQVLRLGAGAVRREDIDHVLARVGPPGADNRVGIERTLHRISAIRNRKGEVIGLTLRVGRAVYGTIDMLRDLIEGGRNLLLLGRPGVGKTTKLRELARVLADDLRRRVVVVDTSNEIGGDGDVPHPGIGGARRMQVPRPDRQHDIMIEAVENHMPQAILVDEIGTAAEAAAARTIAERGVQLIGTAHGNTLENLILNPTLSDLVGGVHTVTLGDEEARRRGTSKTISERRAPPTFDIVVEIVDRDEVLVHADTAQAVDRLLAGRECAGERRRLVDGQVTVEEVPRAAAPLPPPPPARAAGSPARIHAYALSPDLVGRALRDLGLDARLCDRPDHADLILALRARAGDPRVRRAAEHGVPVYVVKRNSTAELRRQLQSAFAGGGGTDDDQVRQAVAEAEHAIGRVMSEGVSVPLSPRPPELRKVQHRLASRFHLESASMGREPLRHLVIYPHNGHAHRRVEDAEDLSS